MRDEFFIFKRRRLSRDVERRLIAAAEELSQQTGEIYRPAEALFGRFIISERLGIIVSPVGTNSRPMKSTIVALGEKRVFLPSIRKGDYDELCKALQIASEADLKTLQELIDPRPIDLR